VSDEAVSLREWGSATRRWLVNPQASLNDGTRLEGDTIMPAHGYLSNSREPISAVYVSKDRLTLQIKDQIFDWQHHGVKVRHGRCGLHRSYIWIRAGGISVVRQCYDSELGKAIDRSEMTFDALDEETTDWWLWLSQLSHDREHRRQIEAVFRLGI
jgi:hypothetical protein